MSGAVLLAARLLVGAILAVAGAAKLADREGSRRAVREFGAPERLARPLGLLLPLVELGMAAALVPTASSRPAAGAAVALFSLFALAVGVALARGRRPDCHCFGRLHSAPAGPTALARNAALAALAILVASRPAPGPGRIELAAAGGAALLAAQAWLWLELLRRYGRALRRIDELEGGYEGPESLTPGSPAPPFVLPDLHGRLVSLDDLLGKLDETILLFTSPACGACDLALREARARRAAVVVVSSGEREDAAAKAEEHQLETVLLDGRREVAELYGIAVVPTAVVVGADGRVTQTPAVGAAEATELLRHSDTSVVIGAEAR